MSAPHKPDMPAAGRIGAGPAASERALQRTLTYRLHQLHKITDLESQRLYFAQLGLSLGDGRCLATVGSFEPLSVNDLARASNLNKGQASRAAQALVERGLAEKSMDPDDARGVVLRLTPQGRCLWQSVMDLIVARNEAIFGCLSAAQQQQLSRLLDRLIAHAQQNPKS